MSRNAWRVGYSTSATLSHLLGPITGASALPAYTSFAPTRSSSGAALPYSR